MGPGGWWKVVVVFLYDPGEVAHGVCVDLAVQGLQVTEFVPDRLRAVVLVIAPA